MQILCTSDRLIFSERLEDDLHRFRSICEYSRTRKDFSPSRTLLREVFVRSNYQSVAVPLRKSFGQGFAKSAADVY